MKSSLPATVNFIGRERNLWAFQQKALARDQVALNTLSSIRDLLSSMRRVKASIENRGLCTNRGLAEEYILR